LSRFNKPTVRVPQVSAIVTKQEPTLRTYNGAPGYERDPKGELFMLGIASMWATDTYYEKGTDRDARFKRLVRVLAVSDPEWTAAFLKWLRQDANMRTISLVGAAEFVKARLDFVATAKPAESTLIAQSGLDRKVVNAVLNRADEPGEFLAYWLATYGRKIPKPVKRGVADAAKRLYTERNFLKYDTDSHAVRFGDVLDLTHPKAQDPVQAKLFGYALDKRHAREVEAPFALKTITYNKAFRLAVAEGQTGFLTDEWAIRQAGMTWEDVLSMAGSKAEKKAMWEALIPSMGIFALVRNLRNFDQAGVSDEAAQKVIDRLQDPVVIAASRMFPFRFQAAYLNAPSMRWQYPLSKAIEYSTRNVPYLKGSTLILVDQSGSMMSSAAGGLSNMTLAQVASMFAATVAYRTDKPTLVQYSNTSQQIGVPTGGEALALTRQFWGPSGGTNTAGALRAWFKGQDRIILLTDEQHDHFGGHYSIDSGIPESTPFYVFNLAGYRPAGQPTGKKNRYALGGLTDQAFKLIPMLEAGKDGVWPWEAESVR